MEDRDGEEENDDLESDDDDEGEAVKGQGKAFSKLDGEGLMNMCTLTLLFYSILFFSFHYLTYAFIHSETICGSFVVLSIVCGHL
jgi:hypothetical protein